MNDRLLTRRAIVLAVWLAALIAAMSYHELWRDELQAWSIAAPATSLADLWHRAAYEPDPNLWFVILYAASRISPLPYVLQIVNVLIAGAAAALVLDRAPFPMYLRVLLICSYMMFFEWGVIARPYALVALLTLACAEAVRRRTPVIVLAALLFLLMTASMYGGLLASGFGALLLWRCRHEREVPLRSRLTALAIVVSGAACVAVKLNHPPDFLFPARARDALLSLASIAQGLTPLVPLRLEFWNAAILPTAVAAAIGAVLFVTAVLTLRTPLARGLFACGAGALLLASYLISAGAWRHHGLLLIAYVAALWATEAGGRAARWFLAAILTVQCLSTIAAVVDDYRYPFSAAPRCARFIEQQGWRDALLIGYPDYTTAPIAGLLGRDVYFVNGDRFGRYAIWDVRRFLIDPKAAPATIARAQRAGRTVVAVAGSGRRFEVPGFELVATFAPATVADETYRIYVVQPVGQSPTRTAR